MSLGRRCPDVESPVPKVGLGAFALDGVIRVPSGTNVPVLHRVSHSKGKKNRKEVTYRFEVI